jgi:hypothetical protein
MTKTDLYVTLLTKRGAMRWTRHAYNVPDHVGLGWTPYQVLVTRNASISHTAFTTLRDFRTWMNDQGYTLRLSPHRWSGWSRRPGPWTTRSGWLYR